VKLRAIRARLDESLFLEAAAADTGARRGEGALLVCVMLILGVVLQLLRLGGSTPLHSIWAEDGQVFLQGALEKGFWEAVLSPYGGYLVLVPRLIGELAAALPLRDAAATTAILASVLVALSGWLVWEATAAYIGNRWLRGALVAATVLAPAAGLESIDSGAYVLWYMLFAVFWVLLWRPRSSLGAGLAALFVLATGLTTPGVWFFAPLAALRTLAARDRRDLAIVVAFWVAALTQVPVLAINETGVEPQWSADIWTAYLQRILDGAVLGLQLGGLAWDHLGWALLVALLVAAAVGLVAGLRRASFAARCIVAIAIPTSLVTFVVSLYQRAVATEMVWPTGDSFGAGSRYAIVPALLLLSAGLILVDRFSRREGNPLGLSLTGAATLGLVAVSIGTSFYVGDSAARGTPSWESALDEAAATCRSEGVGSVGVPTSPPGFGMQVPCDRISSPAPRREARALRTRPG
jgi:hypothetical protein